MNKFRVFFGCVFSLLIISCSGNPPPPTLAPVVVPTVAEPAPTSDTNSDVATVAVDNPTTEPAPTADSPTSTPVILNTIAPATATSPPPSANVPAIDQIFFFDGKTRAESTEFIAPNEIFIRFNFINIQDQSIFKRDWYFNDAIFISREEAWNGEQLGRDGTREDISIFDFESGLTPGKYRVELSLDGVVQQSAEFSILAEKVDETTTPSIQKFANLSFKGFGPYTMETGDTLERPTEMFAEWSYSDMADGDIVRRDWFFNDELFITREEAWDFATLGDGGYINTVSIFDYESGLSAGDYRLELFVNGEFQIKQSVKVVPYYTLAAVVEVVSGKQLLSDNLNTIKVIDSSGAEQTKSVGGRIHSADWFPGGNSLIFAATTITDRQAPFPTFAHSTELWLWNLSTDSLIQIGTTEKRYHSPRVSPDGRHVAVLSGTGYGDACAVDSTLVIFQVDENQNVTGTLQVPDFTFSDIDPENLFAWTVNQDPSYQSNVINTGSDWIVSPGTWIDGATLRTSLGFADCRSNAHGLYEFSLSELTAQKID